MAETPGSGPPRSWIWGGGPGAKPGARSPLYNGTRIAAGEPGSRMVHVHGFGYEPGSWLIDTYLTTRTIPEEDRRYHPPSQQQHPNTAQHELFSRFSADRHRLGLGELRVEPKIAADRWSVKGGCIVRASPPSPSSIQLTLAGTRARFERLAARRSDSPTAPPWPSPTTSTPPPVPA